MRGFALILVLILISAARPQAGAQLLWRVDLPIAKQPSYILGTMHIADISLTDSIEGFKQAFGNAEAVIGELSLDDFQEMTGNPAIMQQASTLRGDTTLTSLVGSTYIQPLDSLCLKYTGVPLSAFDHFVPNMLSMIIELRQLMEHPDSRQPTQMLDQGILQQAAEAHKEIIGLESVGQQLEILFGMPLDNQVAALLTLLAPGDNEPAVIDAYYARDIERMAALAHKDSPAGYVDRLIDSQPPLGRNTCPRDGASPGPRCRRRGASRKLVGATRTSAAARSPCHRG